MGFPADAALLITAEGRPFGNLVVRIDPHAARFDGAGHAQGLVDVTAPDGAAQAVLAVVGQADDLVFRMEFENDGHGPEDFFAGDTHVVGHVADQGRFDKGALGQGSVGIAFAAAQDFRAFVLGNLDIAEDFLFLAFVDLGAHLGVIFPRHADLHLLEGVDQGRYETVINRVLDEDAAAGAADLPLVEKDTQLGAVQGLVEAAIVEDDVSALAAQFQRGGNQLFRCRQGDAAAHFRRTRESQFGKARVFQDILARLGTGAVMMLKTPGGKMPSARRANSSRVRPASFEGFSTVQSPAARTGASFQAPIRKGKFQGMIWPTTPRGS